jgi:hypothetical protein
MQQILVIEPVYGKYYFSGDFRKKHSNKIEHCWSPGDILLYGLIDIPTVKGYKKLQ